jgi:hypothetical protein
MGNLQQHPAAVAGFVIRALGPPVFHPFQDFQAPFYDVVGPLPLDMGNKTDTAGIALIFLPVQTQGPPLPLIAGAALVSPLPMIVHGLPLL